MTFELSSVSMPALLLLSLLIQENLACLQCFRVGEAAEQDALDS